MRRLLLVVFAVLALAGCGAHATDAPTDASNQAKARAAADRIIASLRMPRGSVRVSHSPDHQLARAHAGVSPSDPSLARTAWWRVPLSVPAFETWLDRAHEPGLTISGEAGLGNVSFEAPDTSAYSSPWVVIEYAAGSRGVDVRADTLLTARYARSSESYARSVRSIDIARIPAGPDSPQLPSVHVATAATTAEIVRAFNRLIGAPTVAMVALCPPPVGPPYSDRITFHTAHGDLIAKLGTACARSLSVWRAGRQIGHDLDPRDFVGVVAHAYDAASVSPSRLVGTWHAVGVTGAGGRTLRPPGHPFLTFHADGTVRGSDGVNDFGGRFAVSGGRLRLSNVSSSLVGLASSAPRPLTATVHAFAALQTGSPAGVRFSSTNMTLLLGRTTLTLRAAD